MKLAIFPLMKTMQVVFQLIDMRYEEKVLYSLRMRTLSPGRNIKIQDCERNRTDTSSCDRRDCRRFYRLKDHFMSEENQSVHS